MRSQQNLLRKEWRYDSDIGWTDTTLYKIVHNPLTNSDLDHIRILLLLPHFHVNTEHDLICR